MQPTCPLRSSMLHPGKSQRESNPNSPISPGIAAAYGVVFWENRGDGAWWHEPRVRAPALGRRASG